MTWKSHIRIALRVMQDNNIKMSTAEKWALKIGSVAPDIYIFIKWHKACSTIKNIMYHFKTVENTKRRLIYFFQVGIITHYICDYYCKAHNYLPMMPFIKHWAYEKRLGRYIKWCLKDINYNIGIENDTNVINCVDINDYIKTLEENHEHYLKELYSAVNSFEKDLTYSLIMCNIFISEYKHLKAQNIS